MLLAALLGAFFSLAAPVRAAEGRPVSPVVEERLDLLLADILGPGRARAFVRLAYPPLAAEGTASTDQPAALWDRIDARLKAAPPILPGFRAPRSLREEAVQELVREGGPAERSEALPALSVSIVVDDALAEERVRAASDAVARALALSAEHGDELRVARAPMAAGRRQASPRTPMRAAMAAGATAGMAVLAGLVLVAWALRRPRTATLPAAPSAPPPPASREPPRAAPAPAAFPELDRSDADALAELAAVGPEAAAAWLLEQGRADVAAEVFSRLPDSARRGALRALAAPVAGGGEAASFASRLARRAQAARRIEEIVARLGEGARLEAVAHLREAAPGVARRLEALPAFEDLASAEPEDLRLCLSPFSCAQLAAALQDEPTAVRCAILDALPGVVADLVRERMSGGAAASSRARGAVVARWLRLERDGRVARLTAARG